MEKTRRILVVDDTEATRYAIARTLRGEGYQTIEAGTGREALQLAESIRPDLITLDIHLPDALGFDICRQIKANPETAHIPVLQVSASFVTSKHRVHGLEGGADGYLTHPFEPPVLVATVKALLRTRELNENLRQAEERFRVALKHAPIMAYTTDRELHYTWIYNGGPDRKLGQTDADLYPEPQARHLRDLKQQVIRSGLGQRTTMTLTREGADVCYDMTIEPHFDEAREIAGVTVACIDVTERLLAERAQTRAAEEATFANQAKTRFLANMSHEIRTPLGIIQGYADLSLDPRTSAADRSTFLLTIQRNARALTKLLGEVLDLAKVEAGRMEIETTRFSLARLLSELVETMSLTARERGLELNLHVDERVPEFVVSDTLRLRQILMNLVSNAIKFTERGHVTLRVRPRPPAPGPVRIEISVSDSGVGLTDEQRERLFGVFMQADSSTTRKFGGTGLGLNLSKKLAQFLGGDLVLSETAPGAGSVFTLTFEAGPLPPEDDRVAAPPAPAVVTANPAPPALDGMNILLAEDSLDNQVLFLLYLRQAGAHVDVAADGDEAVTRALAGSYHAILMDVQMPHLDGYGATAQLRERGVRVPIIALTAHAFRDERERALRHGFSDYVTKPVDKLILITTLRKYLT